MYNSIDVNMIADIYTVMKTENFNVEFGAI